MSRQRKSTARVVVMLSGLLLLLSMPLFAGPLPIAHAATSLQVDTNTVVQNDFMGLGGVYHGFSYMPESNNQGMTDGLRQIDFDRVRGIQLHIARTWYGSDWAMPTWGGPYDWNSTRMTSFYNWLQAMKDRNVTVALTLGWWFPHHTCSADSSLNCTPRVPEDVNIYTRWVSDSLNQLINVKGFTNIKYGLLFTEPLGYVSGKVPPGYDVYSYYHYVANQLQTQLTNDGRRNLIQLVGPNSCCFSSNTTPLTWSVSNLNNVFDVYAAHDYNLSGYNAWYSLVRNGVNAVSSTGKPFWLDEYGYADEGYRNNGDYGTYLAIANAGAINAGAQSTQIWLYEDQYYVWPLDTANGSDSFYNGLHKWGTQQWLPASTAVRPSWYSFALMSRFLGGAGTRVYSTTGSSGGVDITATRQSDGNWSIMLVNENNSAADVSVNFTGALNATLYRHLYDPNNVPTNNSVIGASAQFANVTTSLSDTLPARGVAIYTSIDDGTWNGGGGSANLLQNGGFETGNMSHWTVWPGPGGTDGNAAYAEPGGHTGQYRAAEYKPTSYTVSAYQCVTGLAGGTYTASAWVEGYGGQNAAMSIYDSPGGNRLNTVTIPTTLNWQQISISATVSGGQACVAFESQSPANAWIRFDDVTLTAGT